MASEQGPDAEFVQVATDGAGKKIRNISVPALLEDGTRGTVYQQVVTIADGDGKLVELNNETFQVAMLKELRAVVKGLALLTNADLYED